MEKLFKIFINLLNTFDKEELQESYMSIVEKKSKNRKWTEEKQNQIYIDCYNDLIDDNDLIYNDKDCIKYLNKLKEQKIIKEVEKDIKIEKDIPIPRGRMGRPFKYPFKELEIGDSFFVPLKKTENKALKLKYLQTRLVAAGSDVIKNHFKDRKFKTSMIKEPIAGVRVWRIK